MQVSLLQGTEGQCRLAKDMPYLGSCSTVAAFRNNHYLEDIKEASHSLEANCNTGTVVASKKGKFGSLDVWSMPKGIVNIFSMPELLKFYYITYDS